MTWKIFTFLCLFSGVLGMDLEKETKLKQVAFDQNHILCLARAKCVIDKIFDNNRKVVHLYLVPMKQMKDAPINKLQLFRNDPLTEECVENDPTHNRTLDILQYGTDLPSIKEALFLEHQSYQKDYLSLFTSPSDLEGMLHMKAESIHEHNTDFKRALGESEMDFEQANDNTKPVEETMTVINDEPEKFERKAFWRICENRCWFCRCEILPDQLKVETSYFIKSAEFSSPCHAICGAGFQGYECSYYPIGRRPNYTPFEWKILDVFERTGRFVDLNSDFLKKKLKLKDSDYIYKHSIRNVNPDVAFWRDYNGKDWAIHRKWYGKPKDIKWEKHIVEILKTNIMVPTKYIEKIFSKETVEEKVRFSVPIRVIDFIQKYTKCASFEQAVKKYLPEVEFIDCNGERFMRLKMKTAPEENNRESFTSCDSTPKNPNNEFDSPEDALFENLPRYKIQHNAQRNYSANKIKRLNRK